MSICCAFTFSILAKWKLHKWIVIRRVSIFVNVVSFRQLHHIELQHIPCFFPLLKTRENVRIEHHGFFFLRNLYLLFFFLTSNENVLWPFSTFSFNIESILHTSSVGDKPPSQTWSLNKNEFNWHFCWNKKIADFWMNFVEIILKMT